MAAAVQPPQRWHPFAANALVVIHYVRSRTQLKQSALAGH
jgi:hypothetical protein